MKEENNTNTTGNEYDLFFCRSFCFNGKPVNTEKRTYFLVLIFFIVFYICFILTRGMNGNQRMLSCIVSCTLIYVPFVLAYTVTMRNSRKQIFLDRDRKFYLIEFGLDQELTKAMLVRDTMGEPLNEVREQNRQYMKAGNQAQENAQSIDKAAYYVERYKQGIQDYSRLYGGVAKVTYLESFALYKKGTRNSTYTYKKNGKVKKIRLSNQYEGLVDFMSIRGK